MRKIIVSIRLDKRFTWNTVYWSHCFCEEVSTKVKMTTVVICVVTSCGFTGVYQRFGSAYCLHLQEDRSSETLVSACKSTRRQDRQDDRGVDCTGRDLFRSKAAVSTTFAHTKIRTWYLTHAIPELNTRDWSSMEQARKQCKCYYVAVPWSGR
jgi:E3 ubiquitin-protein ligase DOA10